MKEVKSIRCDICYRFFRREKDYIEHCRVKHPAIYEKIKIRPVSA